MGASLGPSPDDHARALGHPSDAARRDPDPWWWSRPHGHLPTGGAPYPTWNLDPDRCTLRRCPGTAPRVEPEGVAIMRGVLVALAVTWALAGAVALLVWWLR